MAQVIQRHGGVAIGNAVAPLVIGEELEVRLDPVPSGQAFGIPAKCQRRRRHDVKAFADGRVRLFHRSLKGVRDIVRVHMMQRLQTKVRKSIC